MINIKHLRREVEAVNQLCLLAEGFGKAAILLESSAEILSHSMTEIQAVGPISIHKSPKSLSVLSIESLVKNQAHTTSNLDGISRLVSHIEISGRFTTCDRLEIVKQIKDDLKRTKYEVADKIGAKFERCPTFRRISDILCTYKPKFSDSEPEFFPD